MRHRKKIEKFSRSRAQRKALIKALLRAVVINERITTTESKAKALRKWVDRLITLAKKDTLHARRLSYRLLGSHLLVKRLFEEIGPRFKDIAGGYSRVIGFTKRKGDNAKLSIFELTKIDKKEKKHKEKKEKEESAKEEKRGEKPAFQKGLPKKGLPKKGLFSGVKKIFKKERDSL